jgi:hypothetical protein
VHGRGERRERKRGEERRERKRGEERRGEGRGVGERRTLGRK